MARALKEIQQQVTNKYVAEMANVGVEIDTTTWSAVNVQRLIIYVFSYCCFILENLFDTHKQEIDDTIKNLKPGTKDWLKQMVLNFQYGYDLPAYSDEYDNTGLSQTEIENSRIVKYCAVDDKGDIEVVKVAASNGSDLIPLTTPQLAALQAYIQKIKYGGVFITVVNEVADSLKYTATVYYNPMLIDNNGVEISTGVTTTKNAIDTHLKSLEFNGVFSPQALQDSLQKVNGVVFITPSLIQVKADAAAAYENVETYYVPASGYLRFINPTHLTLNFLPYVNY